MASPRNVVALYTMIAIKMATNRTSNVNKEMMTSFQIRGCSCPRQNNNNVKYPTQVIFTQQRKCKTEFIWRDLEITLLELSLIW